LLQISAARAAAGWIRAIVVRLGMARSGALPGDRGRVGVTGGSAWC